MRDDLKLIIVGAGGSGKDHLRKRFESKKMSFGITYTTRPMRAGEVDGKDYYFIDEAEFKDKIESKFFVEYSQFNTWYYGTSRNIFESANLFIMNPYSLKKLSKSDRTKSFVIYLDIDESIRKERLSKRNDADSVDRRILADNLDFKNFKDYDLKITNENF